MAVINGFCLTCGSVTGFEQPPCPDAHDQDCPEWICQRCGAAVLVGAWAEVPGRARPTRRGRNRNRQAA